MRQRLLAREKLWELATRQYGMVTSRQATALGINKQAIQMLVHRETLMRLSHGVYRFPQYPTGQYDNLMLAVLWTRLPEVVLSHETALDAYGISDINPNRIHITIGKQRRLRRTDGDGYIVHYEDLLPAEVGWWQEIPTVTATKAIEQCIKYGTATNLLRQALERGFRQGYLTTINRDTLAEKLEARNTRQPPRSH